MRWAGESRRQAPDVHGTTGAMNKPRKLARFYPEMDVSPDGSSMIFLDTFLWKDLLDQNNPLLSKIQSQCARGKLYVGITTGIQGELSQRKQIDKVRQICGDRLLVPGMGHICANQIVAALVGYEQKAKKIPLWWKSAQFEVPVLDRPVHGLKNLIADLAVALTKAKDEAKAKRSGREKLVAEFVAMERTKWQENLRAYKEAMDEIDRGYRKRTGLLRSTFNQFFYTDYFTDLPAITLQCYLFAQLLNERNQSSPIKSNDVVDIYTISELMPYCALYVTDRDNHNRLRRIKAEYPKVFSWIDQKCLVMSTLDGASRPMEALEAFLAPTGS